MSDVPPSSPLTSLRDRIDRARRQAVTDLPVAGLDGVWVRYQALDHDAVDQALKKRNTAALDGDISALARSCVSILLNPEQADPELAAAFDGSAPWLNDDGELSAGPLTFSSDRLAGLLGLETPARPAETVRALFPLELNISDHAAHVANFSRGEAGTVGRSALGN